MPRVLVIKTGETETFADATVGPPSLGDVLRATVLLHAFAEDHVTWLTSRTAAPLLAGNPRIAQTLIDDVAVDHVRGRFDAVVNLEQTPRWIDWVTRLAPPTTFGFPWSGSTRLEDGISWQQGLYKLIGRAWNGEEYIIGAVAPSHSSHIGLNWKVGPRWPTKAWPLDRWRRLAQALEAHCTVSWQEGFDDLPAYMQWIAGCQAVVTTDSLGLHLAIAMRKPVLALFGPTPHWEVALHGRGTLVAPPSESFACSPCRSPTCFNATHCMEALSVDRVFSGAMSMISTDVCPNT